MSCTNQGLLVGKSDVLSTFNCTDGRLNTDHSNNCSKDCICFRDGYYLKKSIHACKYLDAGI